MKLFHRVSPQERVDFTKNLAIMLQSGIAINDALGELAEQSNTSSLRITIQRVRADIENGTLLSVAFAKHENIFGNIFVSLIKAGEESGTLQGNLQFLATWLGRSSDLKREIAAATMYPKMVFSAALLLGGCLALFILPKLVPLFAGMHVELPWITRALLSMSLFVRDFWMVCIIGFISLCVTFVYLNRIFIVRKFFHWCYIHLPLMSTLLRNYQLALATQLFNTLLRSGLTLNESVEIVSNAVSNIYYQEALTAIRHSITKGTSLSVSMMAFDTLFPKMFINIVSVGEKSGTLVQSFEYLAEFYTKEVNAQTKKLPTIIEPLLLVFIAIIVGAIALAIIMPIYKLTGSIST